MTKYFFIGMSWSKHTCSSSSLVFVRVPSSKRLVPAAKPSVGIITLLFLVSTIGLVSGYGQLKEVLIIPVATMFTITSLRQTMPGAPVGFGTSPHCVLFFFEYDTHGVVPSLDFRSNYWYEYIYIELRLNSDLIPFKDFMGLLPCLAIMVISVRCRCSETISFAQQDTGGCVNRLSRLFPQLGNA